MIELLNTGAYLVNGIDIIPDTEEGRAELKARTGAVPCPADAAKETIAYGILKDHNVSGNMVFQTYLVAAGAASLREAIKLFWTFRVPWGWTYTAGTVADWVAQFSFGFYSLMLTSLLLVRRYL